MELKAVFRYLVSFLSYPKNSWELLFWPALVERYMNETVTHNKVKIHFAFQVAFSDVPEEDPNEASGQIHEKIAQIDRRIVAHKSTNRTLNQRIREISAEIVCLIVQIAIPYNH